MILSASLMCVNALDVASDLRALEEAGIDYIHMDAADGHFVPNLGVGMDFIKKVAPATSISLDVHLMVTNPDFWVPKVLGELSPKLVVFHAEATVNGVRLAQTIRERGALAGVAINPGTPVCALDSLLGEVDLALVMTVNPGFAGQKFVPGTLDKIAEVRRRAVEKGLELMVAVDGNVSFELAPKMQSAGADFFICGSSSLFHQDMTIPEAARELRSRLR